MYCIDFVLGHGSKFGGWCLVSTEDGQPVADCRILAVSREVAERRATMIVEALNASIEAERDERYERPLAQRRHFAQAQAAAKQYVGGPSE